MMKKPWGIKSGMARHREMIALGRGKVKRFFVFMERPLKPHKGATACNDPFPGRSRRYGQSRRTVVEGLKTDGHRSFRESTLHIPEPASETEARLRAPRSAGEPMNSRSPSAGQREYETGMDGIPEYLSEFKKSKQGQRRGRPHQGTCRAGLPAVERPAHDLFPDC